MDLYLTAFWLIDPSFWLVFFMVVFGLGLLIFIHELGHFLVAKACGVKCEKFYVGFDVPISIPLGVPFTNLRFGTLRLPSSLWKKQWGETEYGVGILPLGGYVKMLGQDDNPYNQEGEFERAKADGDKEADAAEDTPKDEAAENQDGDAKWDPRSYMAKNVPQRMAIISAGVIMNAILAFILASIAFMPNMDGVQRQTSIIGRISPGGEAWNQNWKVGDQIVEFNGEKQPAFNRDIRAGTLLSFAGQSISATLKDPVTGDLRKVVVKPQAGKDGRPRLGILASPDLELYPKTPTDFGTPAADAFGFPAADDDVQGKDRIVAVQVSGVHDKPQGIKGFYQLHKLMVRYSDKTLELTIERTAAGQSPRRKVYQVKPLPMRLLGLVMKMPDISNVQLNSPADTAGMKAGDALVKIVDAQGTELPLDPMALPEQLRKRADTTVEVTFRRGKTEKTEKIALRNPTWDESPDTPGSQPISAPALGIAYQVPNVVAGTVPGSPAAASGRFKPGATITKVKFIQPKMKDFEQKARSKQQEFELELVDEKEDLRLWCLVEPYYLQHTLPGTKVQLTIKGQEKPVTLKPQVSTDWFAARRGFNLRPVIHKRKGATFGEALALGWKETKYSLGLVVRFLQRIRTLWPEAGGPITIVRFAAGMAEQGFPDYLVFLAMLSANLAVINILPIPVLDGGHMMFLIYEGIRGKPPSEKVLISMNFLGLAFILFLMVSVISLDIGRLLQ